MSYITVFSQIEKMNAGLIVEELFTGDVHPAAAGVSPGSRRRPLLELLQSAQQSINHFRHTVTY
jgi:2-succinyl-5-enolpyruvyl-6-hydroxy-3-cyclohexene-1-carboxylate synthase